MARKLEAVACSSRRTSPPSRGSGSTIHANWQARAIMAVEAEPATRSEPDALGALIGRPRSTGRGISGEDADAGHAGQGRCDALDALPITALIPPPHGAEHSPAELVRARMRSPIGRRAAMDGQAHPGGATAGLNARLAAAQRSTSL